MTLTPEQVVTLERMIETANIYRLNAESDLSRHNRQHANGDLTDDDYNLLAACDKEDIEYYKGKLRGIKNALKAIGYTFVLDPDGAAYINLIHD